MTSSPADAVKVEYLTDEEGEICLNETGNPIVKNPGMTISYFDWEYTYRTVSREEADPVLDLIAAAKPQDHK